MILVSTDYISGKELETLELVKGSIIQARHLGSDIVSVLKGLVGGELVGYSEMFTDARRKATKRMVEQAENLGADAIVNVRYTSSDIRSNASEILVYGTAVKFKE
ncbi:MAG: heavy metal-binding domain-containing protein [Candidatus Marinimicrobia bacterium]|nr:heavy metal-binding domain-containing protein [Candidatus Neomarinimicrobiota bacterium]